MIGSTTTNIITANAGSTIAYGVHVFCLFCFIPSSFPIYDPPAFCKENHILFPLLCKTSDFLCPSCSNIFLKQTNGKISQRIHICLFQPVFILLILKNQQPGMQTLCSNQSPVLHNSNKNQLQKVLLLYLFQ